MKKSALNFIQKAAGVLHRRSRTFRIQVALKKCGLSQANKIQTYTVPDELETLFALAEQCKPNCRMLEVGSYLGASTCYLAAGMRGCDSSIVCVDTWQNETMPDGILDTISQFQANVRSVEKSITLIRKNSSEVSPQELKGPFDLIFLDGDHSYKQTKADFELFSGVLLPQGTIAFHDSLFFEGVSRVIGEALASRQWQIAGNVNNLTWITRAQFAHSS